MKLKPDHRIVPFIYGVVFLGVSPVMAGPDTSVEAEETPVPVSSPVDLITKIKPTVDLRLRYEYGDQDGRDTSNAGTLRGRLGLLSGEYEGFRLFA